MCSDLWQAPPTPDHTLYVHCTGGSQLRSGSPNLGHTLNSPYLAALAAALAAAGPAPGGTQRAQRGGPLIQFPPSPVLGSSTHLPRHLGHPRHLGRPRRLGHPHHQDLLHLQGHLLLLLLQRKDGDNTFLKDGGVGREPHF